MKYEFKSTLGVNLYCGLKPYRKVVNNGCVIETQDELLIAQLEDDEIHRMSKPIDWWLFKPGKTVLTDNFGNQYACIMNNDRKWIQLVKIIKEENF